jgi:hypothetical protein
MATELRTHCTLNFSEAQRREGLAREPQTDRFQRREILGDCFTPEDVKRRAVFSLFQIMRKPSFE